jgi:hypothetical protein
MAIPVEDFIDRLTKDYRVIVIGGLAVIAHGRSRQTMDADIWLEPLSSPAEWANAIEKVCMQFEGARIHRLPGWVEVSGADVAEAAEDTGMIRILGLDCPLDIFRRPNEFDEDSFDAVAERASTAGDGTLLPSPLDLIQSKLDTGRNQDQEDISHLESIIRADYKKRLPIASFEEASELLERYSEWQILQSALENPSEAVKDLAIQHLREFAEAGDPFSLAILEGREIP